MSALSKLMTIVLLQRINSFRKRRRRSMYIRPIFQNRMFQGESFLVKELKDDPEYHRSYFRMDPECFEYLLEMIRSQIEKNRNHSHPIPALDRLALTLRFMATGNSQISLALNYRISPTTVSKILRETLTAICQTLREKYLPTPSMSTFQKSAKQFEESWNFPNVCGSIDGKHIRVKAPKNSGSLNFNYKKYYSKVLFAVVDPNYKFLMVDIGREGSTSDGGILNNSPIKKFIDEGSKYLPRPSPLKNGITVPHVFLGDEAFQLQEHLMKPFGGKWVDKPSRIFNYRLSRARMVVENAFGILSARWRVFHSCIEADEDLINLIIQAGVILHNFLMDRKDWNGITVDIEDDSESGICKGNWRDQLTDSDDSVAAGMSSSNNYSRNAFEIRETFKNYFNSPEGSVPWQNDRAFRG